VFQLWKKKIQKMLIISVTSINQIGSFRMLLDRFYWNWLQNLTLYDRKKYIENSYSLLLILWHFWTLPTELDTSGSLPSGKNRKLNPKRSRANHWKEDQIKKSIKINFFVGNMIVSCLVERVNKFLKIIFFALFVKNFQELADFWL
jgi:hypothetical protein